MPAVSTATVSLDALISVIGGILGGVIAGGIAMWLGHLDRRNQIRVASLDKILETHQQAFTLWRKLISDAKKSESAENTIIECENWWNEHCLYLTPEARIAFQQAYEAADRRTLLLKSHADDQVKKNWETITRAGPVIADGVMQDLGDKKIKASLTEV